MKKYFLILIMVLVWMFLQFYMAWREKMAVLSSVYHVKNLDLITAF